ncbi:hypothetical protein DICA4_B07096 [Diutina catenulata]
MPMAPPTGGKNGANGTRSNESNRVPSTPPTGGKGAIGIQPFNSDQQQHQLTNTNSPTPTHQHQHQHQHTNTNTPKTTHQYQHSNTNTPIRGGGTASTSDLVSHMAKEAKPRGLQLPAPTTGWFCGDTAHPDARLHVPPPGASAIE